MGNKAHGRPRVPEEDPLRMMMAQIAERAVELRKAHRIKLPDAIVWASAQSRGLLLVTRDAKGFPDGDPDIRLPYQA